MTTKKNYALLLSFLAIIICAICTLMFSIAIADDDPVEEKQANEEVSITFSADQASQGKVSFSKIDGTNSAPTYTLNCIVDSEKGKDNMMLIYESESKIEQSLYSNVWIRMGYGHYEENNWKLDVGMSCLCTIKDESETNPCIYDILTTLNSGTEMLIPNELYPVTSITNSIQVATKKTIYLDENNEAQVPSEGWSWNGATQTLSLNNANINNYTGIYFEPASQSVRDFNIELNGTSTINKLSGHNVRGDYDAIAAFIEGPDGIKTNIVGNGSLVINATEHIHHKPTKVLKDLQEADVFNESDTGLLTDSLTIGPNIKLSINEGDYVPFGQELLDAGLTGIFAEDKLECMANSEIDISLGNTTRGAYGIVTTKDIDFSDACKIKISLGNATHQEFLDDPNNNIWNCGIAVTAGSDKEGNVKINNNADISISTGNATSETGNYEVACYGLIAIFANINFGNHSKLIIDLGKADTQESDIYLIGSKMTFVGDVKCVLSTEPNPSADVSALDSWNLANEEGSFAFADGIDTYKFENSEPNVPVDPLNRLEQKDYSTPLTIIKGDWPDPVPPEPTPVVPENSEGVSGTATGDSNNVLPLIALFLMGVAVFAYQSNRRKVYPKHAK